MLEAVILWKVFLLKRGLSKNKIYENNKQNNNEQKKTEDEVLCFVATSANKKNWHTAKETISAGENKNKNQTEKKQQSARALALPPNFINNAFHISVN